jgi:hypothetical protein
VGLALGLAIVAMRLSLRFQHRSRVDHLSAAVAEAQALPG